MDTERLEALEGHVVRLVRAFTRVKADNEYLTQSLVQLRQTLHEQQRTLERWQSDHEELGHLQTMTQALQKEREFIRESLEEMLVAVTRLEGLSHVPGGSQV